MKLNLTYRVWTPSYLTLVLMASTASWACTGGKEHAPHRETSGGTSSILSVGGNRSSSGDADSESSGEVDTGESDATTQGSAPIVEVLSPEKNEVIAREVAVTCLVEQSEEEDASPVDVTTIVGVLRDEDGEILASESVKPSDNESEYSATFSMAELDSGVYSVGCKAQSVDDEPLEGEDFVDVLLDLGPNILAISPVEDSFLSGARVHSFEFEVTANPLFDGDDEAELDGSPVVVIDGVEFELLPKPDSDHVYWLDELSFSLDEFDILPDGPTSVLVKVTNKRGIESRLDYTVTVDAEVPQVTVVSPAAGEIVGKNGVFVFDVTDMGSGVDWSSFVAEFGESSLPYEKNSDRWSLSGSELTLSFPTAEVTKDDGTQIQLHVQFKVRDLVGNEHVADTAQVFFLDQRSPVISLDPPTVRVRRNKDEKLECSHAFDPVGIGAIDDGESSPNLTRFRAFVLDRTNRAPNQAIQHFSGVDASSLLLHVREADVPLVVDHNDDGVCDDVISDEAIGVVPLLAIEPTGSAFFGDGGSDEPGPSIDGHCEYAGPPAVDPPSALCTGNTSDMFYAVPQTFALGAEPAVFAPLVSSGLKCMGDQLEVSNLISGKSDRWVCVAAVGYDSAGNRGVSAPLSVCVGTCDGPAPSCVDDCTPATVDESERILDLY